MKYVIAPVLLLAAFAFGQKWVVEQVDSTAAAGSPVELVKAADGSLWAGYQTKSGVVRAGCLGDSGWSMTDIRAASVPRDTWRPFLAASPHGELCLTCWSADSAWLYRLVRDTWHGEPYPFVTVSSSNMVAYDTAGRLHTAFYSIDGDFWAGQETDSGWTDGLALSIMAHLGHTSAACFTVARDCSPWYYAWVHWEYTSHVWGEQTALTRFGGDTWETVWSQGGMTVHVPLPVALVPHGDSVGRVSVGIGGTHYDSEAINPASGNSVAGLAYSADDVPLVTWVPRGSGARPVFAFKTDRWRMENIPGPPGKGGIDIETDTAGQVVIVYSTPDSGLWCARGIDVVGVEESPSPQVPSRRQEATVLSGASSVERLATSVIFDAMGRRVVNPKPGVYFVREAVSREPSAVGFHSVRKVVVTR